MEAIYGFPAPLPFEVDFYELSNEDIGFTANLATGTNDSHSFSLPYPASIDLFEETIVVHCVEFYMDLPAHTAGASAFFGLQAFISMLQKDFSATYRDQGGDGEDENLKAQLDGWIYFGQKKIIPTAAAAVEGVQRDMDVMQKAKWFPPVPLDLVSPLYLQFVNASVNVTLATNNITDASFTPFEQVKTKVWFTRRKLTAAEKQSRNVAIRFQHLDS